MNKFLDLFFGLTVLIGFILMLVNIFGYDKEGRAKPIQSFFISAVVAFVIALVWGSPSSTKRGTLSAEEKAQMKSRESIEDNYRR